MPVTLRKSVIFSLLLLNLFICQAQSDPTITIDPREISLCDSVVGFINIDITGLNPDLFLFLSYGDSVIRYFSTSTSFVLPLSDRGTYYITGYGQIDPPVFVPCNDSIVINPWPDAYITGGGSFCTVAETEALVVHFRFDSEYVCNYLLNGQERKFEGRITETTIMDIENTTLILIDITDNSCSRTLNDTAFLFVMETVIPEINGDNRLCEGQAGLFNASEAPFEIEWNTAGTDQSEIIAIAPYQAAVSWEEAGLQGLSARYYNDVLQCSGSWSEIFGVEIIDAPDVFDIDTQFCFEQEHLFIELEQVDGESVFWPEINIAGTGAEITRAGNYSYIRSFDQGGCSDTGMVIVLNSCEFDLFVPEAFTPNGDNINDYLLIFGTFHQIDFSIYTPGGLLLFNTRQADQPWDGTRDGLPVPNGSYNWRAILTGTGGMQKVLSGIVTLIR
jgi:gliding motility-associated-like protein